MAGSKFKSNKRVHDSDEDEPRASTKKSKSISTDAQKDSEGNTYWELSNNRRVQISDFKGKRMVNVREFYQQDGEWKPGKKGISLPMDQFNALLAVLPQVVDQLSGLGEEVNAAGLSGLGSSSAGKAKAADDGEAKARGNHESTSDED